MTDAGFSRDHLFGWPRAAQHALEYVLLVDRSLRVHYLSHPQPGGPDPRGSPLMDFVEPSGQARLRDTISEVFASAAPGHCEVGAPGPNGTFTPYSVWVLPATPSNEVGMVALVCADLGEQRRVERALQDERQLLRSLLENAPDTVIILDREHRVQFINHPRLGFTREQIIGTDAYRFLPIADRARVRAVVESVFATGEPASYEAQVEAPNGVFVFSTRVGPILIDGAVDRVSLVATDVTARCREEAERTRLQAELFQAQKLQAIGQLTGGVAHDFNNLLTVILSHAELLDHDANNRDAVRSHAKEICAASLRAAALTQQLLAFARRQPLQPRAVDIAALVNELAKLLRRTLGETILIQIRTVDEPLVCGVDPMQLENALLNLAINARDAMPAGGTLWIRAGKVEVDARTDGPDGPLPPGEYALLSVEDEGCGIAPELRDKVFEPFFTTKDVGSGSGLGLSMVYGFVKQSGGHLELHSEVGRGTRMDILLPLQRGGATPEQRSVDPGSAPSGAGETIVVVEDEPQVRAVTVGLLRKLGYRPVEAHDAATGLQAITSHRDVALLLTDLVLPGGVSGAELTRRARQLRPDLQVVFMSGYAESTCPDLEPGRLFLQKPFKLDDLARIVRSGLRHRQDSRTRV